MSDWGPFSVAGKNAVVTGAALGIGFGISKRLAEGGANVLLVDSNPEAIAAAPARLGKTVGRITTLLADVADDAAGETIIARCVEDFGSLDVLVNNAGIFPQVPLLKVSPEVFDRVYRINLRGVAFLSQAAGRQWVKQGRGGSLINIGSVDCVHPSMVGLAAYDASKGGMWMLTKNFALEMAPHRVRVNAIFPGGVQTEGTSRPLEGSGMTEEQTRAFMEQFIKTKVPMGRMGAPDDIATAAVFLASSASSYMTGSAVTVDGGMLLT